LLASLEGKYAVLILNKTDLCDTVPAPLADSGFPLVSLCAKSGDGLDTLTAAVAEVTGIAGLTGDEPMLANERQHIGASRCLESVNAAVEALKAGFAEDAAAVCIDEALAAVLELTGERVSDTVVQEVFSRFCVGK